jgi:uncharacterized membrane protein YhdT
VVGSGGDGNIMTTPDPISKRTTILGSVLIAIVGLFNFHLPHFVLERSAPSRDTDSWIEVVFVANLFASILAAVAIWRMQRWGWLLGMLVVGFSVALYVVQETLGLPGLPHNWLEPSRILSLIFGVLFILLARYVQRHLARSSRMPG